MPTIQEHYAQFIAAPRDFLSRHAVKTRLSGGESTGEKSVYFTCLEQAEDNPDVDFAILPEGAPEISAMEIRVYFIGTTPYAAVERNTFLPCGQAPNPFAIPPGAPYDLVVTSTLTGCTIAHVLNNPAGPLLCHVQPTGKMSGLQLQHALQRPRRIMAESNIPPDFFGREDFRVGTANVIGVKENGRWCFYVQYCAGNYSIPSSVSSLKSSPRSMARQLWGSIQSFT
ncbi:MAG: hypothetical protein ACPGGK_01200 [Pikeienuella sp.]